METIDVTGIRSLVVEPTDPVKHGLMKSAIMRSIVALSMESPQSNHWKFTTTTEYFDEGVREGAFGISSLLLTEEGSTARFCDVSRSGREKWKSASSSCAKGRTCLIHG